jgi:hypothetical protein
MANMAYVKYEGTDPYFYFIRDAFTEVRARCGAVRGRRRRWQRWRPAWHACWRRGSWPALGLHCAGPRSHTPRPVRRLPRPYLPAEQVLELAGTRGLS